MGVEVTESASVGKAGGASVVSHATNFACVVVMGATMGASFKGTCMAGLASLLHGVAVFFYL